MDDQRFEDDFDPSPLDKILEEVRVFIENNKLEEGMVLGRALKEFIIDPSFIDPRYTPQFLRALEESGVLAKVVLQFYRNNVQGLIEEWEGREGLARALVEGISPGSDISIRCALILEKLIGSNNTANLIRRRLGENSDCVYYLARDTEDLEDESSYY